MAKMRFDTDLSTKILCIKSTNYLLNIMTNFTIFYSFLAYEL